MRLSNDQQITVAFYADEVRPTAATVAMTWMELVETLTEDRPSLCTLSNCIGKKCPHKSCSDGEEQLGAWSPVELATPYRLNENVKALHALVLDGDGLTGSQLETLQQSLCGGAYVVHTTHRHRPDNGAFFVRAIVQLSRPVPATEWKTFYHRAISLLGLDGICDPTCKDLSRLYFLPTHPSDVEFLSEVGQGEPLDVDKILSRSPSTETEQQLSSTSAIAADHSDFEVAEDAVAVEFTDLGALTGMLKVYLRQRAHGNEIDKEKSALVQRLLAGKPLAAPGGNAEPSILEIPAELPRGRGHAIMRTAAICTGYLPSSTPDEAYLAIFARSLDAMCFGRITDRPEMEEHLLEKVRIGREHRTQFEEEAQKRASAAKTYRQALMDERTKAKQRAGAKERAFTTAVGDAPEDPEPLSTEDWTKELRTSKDGNSLLGVALNASIILRNDEAFENAFKWNEVSLQIDTFGMFAGVERESLDVHVANYVAKKWGYDGSFLTIYRNIQAIAFENRYDPIQEYLRSLVWDKTKRISKDGGWLKTYAGAVIDMQEDEDNTWREVALEDIGEKWLIACAARALDPGCKADNVLVLEGAQGKRKSSLLEALGGEFYADMTLAIGDKDSKMIAARSWICEIPDLAALKKTGEINAVKAFFSTRIDTFRPPFAKAVMSSPRRNVFGGTTNEEQYLGDPTGNRRFWCVRCEQIDLAAVVRDRDQLWAEAVFLYDKHVNECENKLECGCWWFNGEGAKKIEKITKERMHESVHEAAILEWWTEMEKDKRPRLVTTNTVAKDAMKFTQDRIQPWVLMSVGTALQEFGWVRTRTTRAGKNISVYRASDDLMEMEQSEEGKRKTMKFKPNLKVVP